MKTARNIAYASLICLALLYKGLDNCCRKIDESKVVIDRYPEIVSVEDVESEGLSYIVFHDFNLDGLGDFFQVTNNGELNYYKNRQDGKLKRHKVRFLGNGICDIVIGKEDVDDDSDMDLKVNVYDSKNYRNINYNFINDGNGKFLVERN